MAAMFVASTVQVAAMQSVKPPVLVRSGLPTTTPPSTVAVTLLDALQTGACSDVRLDDKWPLHRCVLCARAPALLRQIDQSNNVVSTAISDAAVDDVLHFIYTGHVRWPEKDAHEKS